MSSPTPQAAAPGGEEDAPPSALIDESESGEADAPPPPVSDSESSRSSRSSAGADEDEASDYYEYDLDDAGDTTSSSSYSNSTDDDNGDEGDGDDGTGGDEVSDNCCCVCMEPWTSAGKHRVCCVPCGHVYGRSCLLRWLRRCRRGGMAAKCPQCCHFYERDEIINLYSTTVCHRKGCTHHKAMVNMVSGELMKKIVDMVHMVSFVVAQLLQELRKHYTPDEMLKILEDIRMPPESAG